MPFIICHEGHHHPEKKIQKQELGPSLSDNSIEQIGRPLTWTGWLGNFHFVFLHFPIALITMAGIAEFLLVWKKKSIFDYSAQFMLISAAIWIIPTAFSGHLYRYGSSYTGILSEYIWWHMIAGSIATALTIILAFIRYYFGVSKSYYAGLLILFLLINLTGYLGGCMTFGPYFKYFPLANSRVELKSNCSFII